MIRNNFVNKKVLRWLKRTEFGKKISRTRDYTKTDQSRSNENYNENANTMTRALSSIFLLADGEFFISRSFYCSLGPAIQSQSLLGKLRV